MNSKKRNLQFPELALKIWRDHITAMKIGILTHYFKSKNIGGLCQAYALASFLLQNGFNSEQISFDYFFFDFRSKVRALYLKIKDKGIIELIRVLMRKYFFKSAKKNNRKEVFNLIKKQNILFSEFENFIPHSILKYNTKTAERLNEIYDLIIVGSDQIWNESLLPLSAYYGEFAYPNKRVISYAASSNVSKFLPAAERVFIKKLSRLNAISVRERTLKNYIEGITDCKAEIVLDPTYLLRRDEWLKISNQSVVPEKPYIFCYFLGDNSVWQRKAARDYADKYGYEVVHLPYITKKIRQADECLGGQGRYDVGPREFVSLIDKAQCVLTDSFHGLAFSINFGKNFYVFDRDDKSGLQSMNARITDTLEMFGLSSRHITKENIVFNNEQIDYSNVHRILNTEREKSISWLLNALSTSEK